MREPKNERAAMLTLAAEREMRNLSTVGIGVRWAPGAVVRRDTERGTFEAVNTRRVSLDAEVIQQALICKVPPRRSTYLIRSVLLSLALFGALAVVLFFYASKGGTP